MDKEASQVCDLASRRPSKLIVRFTVGLVSGRFGEGHGPVPNNGLMRGGEISVEAGRFLEILNIDVDNFLAEHIEVKIVL